MPLGENLGNKGGGGRVKLLDVDTRELAGFQNQFICRFMMAVDVVGVVFRSL